MTYNPRGFTNIGSINMNRPFVNGNREQTNNFTVDGIDVNETIDNRVAYQPSPDARGRDQRRDQQLRGRHRQRRRRRRSATSSSRARTSSAATPSSSTATATSTRTRGRTTLARRRSRSASSTSTAARSAARSSRTSCSSSATTRDRGRTRRAPAPRRSPRRPGGAAISRASAPRSAIRAPGQPFPGNQIPVSRISPTARALLNDLANYPLPNRVVPGGVTGNFVGDTLLTIRAHQGDVRVDWNPSTNDKFFGRYSFATYEDQRDKQPFPLVLDDAQRPAVPQRRRSTGAASSARRWSTRCSSATATSTVTRRRSTGRASATATPSTASPADSRSTASVQIGWGSGLTLPGHDRHRLRHARQDLPDQREADLAARAATRSSSAASSCTTTSAASMPATTACSASSTTTARSPGFAVLRLPARHGVEQGARRRRPERSVDAPPEPQLAVRAGRLQAARTNLTLNLGLRWAYTSPLVEKDNRQSNFDLVTGQQTFAEDGSIEDRALYKPYYKGFEPRLGAAWRAERPTGSFAAATASRSSWKAPAPTCGCRSTRRSSSSRRSTTTQTTGAGNAGERLRGPGARHHPIGQRPRLRSRTCGRSSRSSGTSSPSTC